MAYQTIRKNAAKKIAALLADAVGITAKTSSMQLDDSHKSSYRLADPAEVVAWLAEHDNYRDARVYIDSDGAFHVCGPYHFCDAFVAYFDQAAFDEALEWKGLKAKPAPAALPAGVTSLCEYRRRRVA